MIAAAFALYLLVGYAVYRLLCRSWGTPRRWYLKLFAVLVWPPLLIGYIVEKIRDL